MKKIISLALALALSASAAELKMATTTSTDNTGLLDALKPLYEKESGNVINRCYGSLSYDDWLPVCQRSGNREC